MRAPRRSILVAAQVLAALILFAFVGRVLLQQWRVFRDIPLEAQFSFTDIAISGGVVLFTYALLVQTWRVLLGSAAPELTFWRAARIWSVSNLWRYVPGKLWQVGAMSVMAQRENVSAMSAAGSAILSTILNIASGLAIVLVLGWRWIDELRPDARVVAAGLIVAAVAGLVLLPFTLPRLAAVAARLTGREVQLRSPPALAIIAAITGHLLAWVLYGAAFLWMVRGVLGELPGAPWQYIAVFTASYVVGYLFLILPGGIGPREAVMVLLLTTLALATPKQAWLVAGASRVWLTLLEIAPGLLFIISDAIRRPPAKPPANVLTPS